MVKENAPKVLSTRVSGAEYAKISQLARTMRVSRGEVVRQLISRASEAKPSELIVSQTPAPAKSEGEH